MLTSVNLPPDLYQQIKLQADEQGRPVEDVVADLLKASIPAPATPPNTEHKSEMPKSLPVIVSTDPATGLPVIHSPAEAPIRSMSINEILAIQEQVQLQGDLERAGFPVRQ
jgi:hypothetical protein